MATITSPIPAVVSVGRPSPPVAARRRLVALALVAVVVMAATAAGERLAAGQHRRPGVVETVGPRASPPGTTGSPGVAPAPTYLVQPGDTLWSVAVRLEPGTDPRATVDRLADLNGGAAIDAGQRLALE